MSIMEEIIATSIDRHRETGHKLEQFVVTPEEAKELLHEINRGIVTVDKIKRVPDHLYLPTGDKVRIIVGP